MGSIVLAIKINHHGVGEGADRAIDLIQEVMELLKKYKTHNFYFDVELIMNGSVDDLAILGKAVILASIIRKSEDLQKKPDMEISMD